VQFTLSEGHAKLPCISFAFPAVEEVYPTLTLYSPDVQVMSLFSGSDLSDIPWGQMDVPVGEEVFSIDGMRLS
jgi:hypothetical protein